MTIAKLKLAMLIFVAAGLMAWSPATQACHVTGRIVCDTDPSVPIIGFTVTFTPVAPSPIPLWLPPQSDQTDGSGAFALEIARTYTYAANFSTLQITCPVVPISFALNDIQVADSERCPAACPLDIEGTELFEPDGYYCPERPVRTPTLECALFGLEPVGVKDEDYMSPWTASTTARLALVKAANCYSYYENVVAGETVFETPSFAAISHVTYCGCPD